MSKELGNRRQPFTGVLVSVILPVYNEAQVLHDLVCSIHKALAPCGCRHEIIFVNDGSEDESHSILDQMTAIYEHVRALHFSRNFGHQAAVQAGLEHARGDAIMIMDADLQDDPASLPRFLDKWRDGYDVVYAIRSHRKEALVKRFLFFAFYRLLNAITETPIPNDAGNFGLIDRKVADAIAGLQDRDRFYPGLRRWVGFRQVGIPIERGARYDARPRVSLRGLWRLAKNAVFSFSVLPLTVFYGIAALSLLVFVALGCFTCYHKLFTGLAIPGWTSLLMAACFFGAMNAFGIAVLGEYVARIYNQVRARPLFLIDSKTNFPEDPSKAAPDGGQLSLYNGEPQDSDEPATVWDITS